MAFVHKHLMGKIHIFLQNKSHIFSGHHKNHILTTQTSRMYKLHIDGGGKSVSEENEIKA